MLNLFKKNKTLNEDEIMDLSKTVFNHCHKNGYIYKDYFKYISKGFKKHFGITLYDGNKFNLCSSFPSGSDEYVCPVVVMRGTISLRLSEENKYHIENTYKDVVLVNEFKKYPTGHLIQPLLDSSEKNNIIHRLLVLMYITDLHFKSLEKTMITCVIGKSCSGKSTYIKSLENIRFSRPINVVKSYTTRAVREDEPGDENTHTFVSREFYEETKDKHIAIYHDAKRDYYNWVDGSLFIHGKDNIWAIDPVAYVKFFKEYKDKYNIECVYIEIDELVRKDRWLHREHNLKHFTEEIHLSKDILDKHGIDYLTIRGDK